MNKELLEKANAAMMAQWFASTGFTFVNKAQAQLLAEAVLRVAIEAAAEKCESLVVHQDGNGDCGWCAGLDAGAAAIRALLTDTGETDGR